MELIVGSLLALPLYLAAGITVARARYNIESQTEISPETQEEIDRLNKSVVNMDHSRYCDTKYGLSCDCHVRSQRNTINEQIEDLKKSGVEPKMSTIGTWPGYLLKLGFLKVYTPRPKPEKKPDVIDSDEVSEYESPYLAKIYAMEERARRRKEIENDPMYKQFGEDWAKVEQAFKDDFAPKINTKKVSR